jgi:hypothetical protein
MMLDSASMPELMNQLDVVKVTEVFLVPGSILVGALGVARTEGLKSGISAIGLLLTALWLVCIFGAYWGASPPKPWRLMMLVFMPWLFLVSWGVSLRVHVTKYCREQGKSVLEFLHMTWLKKVFGSSERSSKE